jgi:hypothetical protein
MPKISAPVLKPISINGVEYQPGSIFRQPTDYDDKYVVYLWLKGEIGEFALDLLNKDIRSLVLDSDWCEIMRTQLLCPSCR